MLYYFIHSFQIPDETYFAWGVREAHEALTSIIPPCGRPSGRVFGFTTCPPAQESAIRKIECYWAGSKFWILASNSQGISVLDRTTLTNVARHADVDEVIVRIWTDESQFYLQSKIVDVALT
jgi:hypothetical protein